MRNRLAAGKSLIVPPIEIRSEQPRVTSPSRVVACQSIATSKARFSWHPKFSFSVSDPRNAAVRQSVYRVAQFPAAVLGTAEQHLLGTARPMKLSDHDTGVVDADRESFGPGGRVDDSGAEGVSGFGVEVGISTGDHQKLQVALNVGPARHAVRRRSSRAARAWDRCRRGRSFERNSNAAGRVELRRLGARKTSA